MAESPLSPVGNAVGMDVVVDLNSSASTVLNENSTASTDTASGGVAVPVDLQCPATPQLNLKLPDYRTSSSESDDEAVVAAATSTESAGGGRPASPPPNCAICLGRCKNKCFTDSCMHQFCFKCLCEWSKVKPECPLCKQTFKSIIHNVKSIDQFEEYHVQPPAVQILHPIEVNYRQLPYIVDVVNSQMPYSNLPGAHRLMRTGRTTFYPSSSSASADGTGAAAAAGSGNNSNVQNQFIHRGELLDMYRQEFPDAIASSGTLSQLWRRYVYDRKLYALPVCDITGRFRESSARFYRDNPAQIHRLVPWINRDIVCLLRNTDHDVSFVLERINEWITMTNILSPLFRRCLQPILGTKTAHFIHELNNFARSPYDMIGYDRAVQYSPQNTSEVVIEFTSSSSSSSSDEEQVNIVDGSNEGGDGGNTAPSTGTEVSSRSHRSRNRNANQSGNSRNSEYRVQSRGNGANGTSSILNLLSFTISTTSEGVEAPGVTVAVSERHSSQSAAINLTTHNRASEVIIDLDDTDLENSTNTNDASAAQSSSSSGGAPFTLHPMPTVTENIELSSTSSDECEFVLERKPPHLRTPEMVSLNSESDSDVVFVEANCNQMTYSTSENELSKYAKHVKEGESHDSKVNLKNETVQDSDYEDYNVGASTSAGLRSSGRRRRQKSIDMEKKKLRKQERRRKTLRSSKDSFNDKSKRRRHNANATHSNEDKSMSSSSSTSSDDDCGSDGEYGRHSGKRTRRMKRKSSEKRVTRKTRSTNEKDDKPTETTRRCKRKCSLEGRSGKDTKKSRSSEEKQKSTAVLSDESDYSSTDDDDCLSLNKLKNRLKVLKEQVTSDPTGPVSEDKHEGHAQSNKSERSSTANGGEQEEEHDPQRLEGEVKFEVTDEQNPTVNSSNADDERRHRDADQQDNEDHEEGNNFTASNCYNAINNGNAATNVTSLMPTEPPSTPAAQQSQPPENQQIQHAQNQVDDTTFSSITQTTTAKTRSSSRTSRSSIYTTTTTTTSDSSSTSSSSSSSTSDDSDSDNDGGGNGTKAKTKEQVVDAMLRQQQQEHDVDAHEVNFNSIPDANALGFFNMTDTSPSTDTQEAATNEAAAALADFANISFRLQMDLEQDLANAPIYSSSEDNADNNREDDEM